MRRRVSRATAALLLSLSLPAGAESQPKAEFGVGGAVGAVPTYRGSSHYGVVALPFPYFAYRGERLRVGRQGAGLRALSWDDFHIGVSGALAVPGHGGDDPAREGMPDLDPTFEFGPSLDWRQVAGNTAWCICLPIRFATATDGEHWRGIGWVAHPQVRVRRVTPGEYTLTTTAVLGPKFADHRYHDYFYEVRPGFATAGRPAFDAAGGYSGLAAGVSLYARKGNWGAGAGLLGDWLEGAAFEDSPLVKVHGSLTVGLWVTYSLWTSGSTDAAEDVAD
jgi:outer membrane scaffolding protein for murein synthesis (MipA/OmpV family)